MTNTEKKLDIPFFSQFDPTVPEEDQKNICGIACIKMIVDYKTDDEHQITDFLDERERLQVRVPGVGSSHAGLARILRNSGVLAYPQEFRADTEQFQDAYDESMLDKIVKSIDNEQPFIASIIFEELDSTHLVVVSGYILQEGKVSSVIIQDPYMKYAGERVLPLQEFLEISRRLFIFTD